MGAIKQSNRHKLDRAQDLMVKAKALVVEVINDEEKRFDDSTQSFTANELIRFKVLKHLDEGSKIQVAIACIQTARFANAGIQNEASEEHEQNELAQRTETNMNLICAFLDHIKDEAGIDVPDGVFLSFFNA